MATGPWLAEIMEQRKHFKFHQELLKKCTLNFEKQKLFDTLSAEKG
jgi:hypothetical protein